MQPRMPVWLQILLTLVVGACVFLVGALPADGDLGDVTFVQWLLLVVFLGGLMGITIAPTPDPAVVARVDRSGVVLAGEAARYETGTTVSKSTTLATLVDPHATRSDPTPEPPAV